MASAKKKSKSKSQAEQSERFLRAAEEAEADESGKRFERVFMKVVVSPAKKRVVRHKT